MNSALRLVKKHEDWRSNCINLIPSENVTSPAVRTALSSDLVHRYTSSEGYYSGTMYINRIEEAGKRLAAEIFGSQWASLRPLSGHMADMILLASFTAFGDKILVLSPANGGYPGISDLAFPRILGLKTVYLPYDWGRLRIDVEAAVKIIRSEKPKLVILGASFIPFTHPVREIAEACQDYGALVAYDGSHVLGLIAGGVFQDPLREGASVLLGSTHKSFFGPQGGIILSDNALGEKMEAKIHHTLVDNAHWNRIAALTIALEETKKFGERYARQIVRNSQRLARTLDENGINVLGREYGYTESHQVLLDVGGFKRGMDMAAKLQEANIIVDAGVRLGTCEVTRLGMREGEMEEIAHMAARLLKGLATPRQIRSEALRLRRKFKKVHFA